MQRRNVGTRREAREREGDRESVGRGLWRRILEGAGKKMTAEARKMAILVVNILIEVGDVEAESNQGSCVA